MILLGNKLTITFMIYEVNNRHQSVLFMIKGKCSVQTWFHYQWSTLWVGSGKLTTLHIGLTAYQNVHLVLHVFQGFIIIY